MWFRFFFFLPFMTICWLGLHYITYKSTVFLFHVSAAARPFLLAFFMLMAISFLIASVLGHWFFNAFTRAYYWISVVWMGFFANLFLITVIGWILIYVLNLFYISIPYREIGILIYIFGLSLSIYGVWNAYHYRIKNITVHLKNIPVQWKGKNVVQISDIHLGQVHGAKFMEDIAKDVNNLNPEAIFITGDLFDGMDGKFEDYIEAIDSLRAPQGVYFIIGNHEVYLGLKRIVPILENTKLNILNDDIVNLDGIQLIGISHPDFGGSVDFEKTLNNHHYDKTKPSVLLTHAPIYIDKAVSEGVDLQLAGHTHLGQIFPNRFLTHLFFRGFDYGLHTIGEYQIYTTSGVGTWGPPLRTGNTPEIVNINFE